MKIIWRAIFCSLILLTTQKIKILKKWKKNTWRYHFTLTWVPHIMIIWCNHTDMECDSQNVLTFWNIFCPFTFYPQNNPENQNEKMPGDIILHMCTINENHMMHGSWDMECNRHFFSNFGPFFVFLTPLKTKNSKFWKMEKKKTFHRFTLVYQKSWSYAIMFLRYDGWQM